MAYDDGFWLCVPQSGSEPGDPNQPSVCTFFPSNDPGTSTQNPPTQPAPVRDPVQYPQPQPPAPPVTTPVNQLDVRVVEGISVVEGRSRSASGSGEECGVLPTSGRNRGVESAVWDNPQFVAAEGGQASVQLSGQSDTLIAQDFGFSIPNGATVTGITICIRRRVLG